MTVEEDTTAVWAAQPIVETKAFDMTLVPRVILTHRRLLDLRTPVEESHVQAINRNRMAVGDRITAAATINSRELQQHVAEHTSSATLRIRKPSPSQHSGKNANPVGESLFMHFNLSSRRAFFGLAAACLSVFPGTKMAPAQKIDTASVVRLVDASVKARIESIEGYTATEHYAVYRSNDEIHPVAEMTVITTYQKDSGKSYRIVSQTGSKIIQKLVLGAILDNEKQLNEPGIRESAWITSANYQMELKPGGIQVLDGRNCLVLSLVPRRKASFLIEGTLWVDSKDGSIVQLQGISSKSSSLLTGLTEVKRQYANVNGFSQATQVRAVSNSFMFGQTVVKIDYRDYDVQLRPSL